MIALHGVLTQVVNIRPGINSLVTRVHHMKIIDMYPKIAVHYVPFQNCLLIQH